MGDNGGRDARREMGTWITETRSGDSSTMSHARGMGHSCARARTMLIFTTSSNTHENDQTANRRPLSGPANATIPTPQVWAACPSSARCSRPRGSEQVAASPGAGLAARSHARRQTLNTTERLKTYNCQWMHQLVERMPTDMPYSCTPP